MSEVVGSKESNVYHAPGSSCVPSIYPCNIVKFASAEEAEKAGYRRCDGSWCFSEK